MILATWIACLSLIGILLVFPAYMRREMRRERLANHSRTKFMECGEVLLKDKDTPIEAILLLEKMYHKIDSPWVARSILWAALSGRLRNTVKRRASSVDKMMNAMRPELQSALIQAAVHFSFAASYSSNVLGPIFRRMMLIFAKEARNSTATVAMWEAERPEHFWRSRGHAFID